MEIICLLLLLCRRRHWRWWQRSDKWLNIIAQWAATAPVNLSRAEIFGCNIFIRRRWITSNKNNKPALRCAHVFMFWITFQLLLKPVHKQSQEPQSIKKRRRWLVTTPDQKARLWCGQLYTNTVSTCHNNAYVTMSLLSNQLLPQIHTLNTSHWNRTLCLTHWTVLLI